eukprot:26226-Alexandrium_andersonii.AAC.1
MMRMRRMHVQRMSPSRRKRDFIPLNTKVSERLAWAISSSRDKLLESWCVVHIIGAVHALAQVRDF